MSASTPLEIPNHHVDMDLLMRSIRSWSKALGFNQIGVSDIDLSLAESRLEAWLDQGFHGEMGYMQRHGTRRTRPAELVDGTLRVISARMDYRNPSMDSACSVLDNPNTGYISRYALGRDYHKVMRSRLRTLATRIAEQVDGTRYRVFCDSAPVMEKPLAEKSGLGWMGKHTNMINRHDGSWFFLGELYTNLPLPIDQPTTAHCGSCSACIDICPTNAIVEPYLLDARRCISYHTIELHGPIPVEFRRAMANRIYGCDDCQLVCPWNRHARLSAETDFSSRHDLENPDLVELFDWDEQTFLYKTEGSAIRRIGFLRWLRNIAVALGNAPASMAVINALKSRLATDSDLVREHVLWALEQHE